MIDPHEIWSAVGGNGFHAVTTAGTQRQSDDTEGVLVPTGPSDKLTLCQRVTNTAPSFGLSQAAFVKLLPYVR